MLILNTNQKMIKNNIKTIDLEPCEYDIVTSTNQIHTRSMSKKVNLIFSFLLGIILTTAFAPLNFLPSIVISFSGYYYLTTKYRDKNEALLSGYLFGLGHYSSSLYWFSNALLVQADQFAWLIPFAILIIPSILAIYFVVVSWVTHKFQNLSARRYLAFCTLITITEYLKGNIIIPFPWNNLPYVLANWDNMLQASFYLNQLTITFFLVFFSSLLSTLNLKRILVVVTFFLSLHLFGEWRLKSSTPSYTNNTIRIVQPNFAVHHFGNHNLQTKQLSILAVLTNQGISEELKGVIWPESAFPYLTGYGSYRLKILGSLAPKNGYLITGSDTYDLHGRYYNSIIAVNESWMIAKRHDKKYLVPFGEYIPFRDLIPFVEKIAYGMGEFTKGSTYNNYDEKDEFLHFVALVCYEIIFPLSENDAENAKWIINVTNDAWFGKSIGPYQHLAMAKYKSAEYGIPIVRVANTGISAVFSPYGQFLVKTQLNQQQVVDALIPTRIAINNAFFKKSSILLWILLLIVCIYREKSLRIWWEK